MSTLLREDGVDIGQFKASSLMKEMGLASRQLVPHKYKKAVVEQVHIPNTFAREFAVTAPNKFWSGDITYIWAGSRWRYMAVLIDPYARKIVGSAMSDHPAADPVIKALDNI